MLLYSHRGKPLTEMVNGLAEIRGLLKLTNIASQGNAGR